MKKYDIAGFVGLHTPGFGEYVTYINTSYSCATTEGETLRLITKGRDLEDVTSTVNMVASFMDLSAFIFNQYESVMKVIKEHIDIDDEPGIFTSHTDLNN